MNTEQIQTLKVTAHNNLDYVGLPILQFSSKNLSNPTMAGLIQTNNNQQFIHQKFDHRSLTMIHKMQQNNLMLGMPHKIHPFHDTYKCPICLLTNATKVPRNLYRHKEHYQPGEYFCLDYSFWNVTSIRGFTSILSAICAKTRYSFAFPTRNKRPPLATIKWFINTLRRQGYPVLYIQTDEGGELGRSTDFLKLLTDNDCVYIGTGKSGSSLNGIVERPNRTIANSVRAKLLSTNLDDKFWCYAAEDSNFKLRRMLHSSLHTTPFEAWTGTKPQYDDMKIWGCHVYIVDTDISRTKLSNRTYVGLFMKFSSSTKIVVYYNPKTKKFGRASHAYFDEMSIGLANYSHTQTPGTNLITNFPSTSQDIRFSEIKSDISLLPILTHPAVTFEIILPPVDHICPIKFFDDEVYGLPYVKNIPKHTPIGQQLPTPALKQQWILNIGMEEPIHASSAQDELLRLRRTHANKKIQITMAPQVVDNNNKYETERSKFDQMRPILASVSQDTDNNLITSSPTPQTPQMTSTTTNISRVLSSEQHDFLMDPAGPQVPTISILVHSPHQPTTSGNIHDCFALDNPHKSFWIQTIYEQFDKNASYRVFTKPIPRSTIPQDHMILKSVLAPTVKSTNISSLWKLNVRHCVNGRPMKGMTTYGATHASTVSPDTVRFQLSFGTSLGFKHKTFDCTNAFQCTFEEDPSKQIYCHLPPFYTQWYNSRYPHDKIDPSNGPYIMQAAQLIQGSPHAANRWQENLSLQITSMGFVRNNVDHSFYVKYDQSKQLVAMLSITVDDLLLSYKTEDTQQIFYNKLSSAFDVTTPSDTTRMKFLSLHIFQSSHGTSIDQTTHINQILATWFDNGHPTRIVNSPFPTDSAFELALSQSPSLEGSELELYETRFHGAFNHTVGKLLHVQQWTRPDINYAVIRLASFTRNPNKYAFLGLEHLMQYLHSHLHEPIFYPCRPMGSPQTIDYHFSPKQSLQYLLPSNYIYCSDSAFGNILPERRTMQANCALFNGSIVAWSTNIQSSIAADSTDAEIRALYTTIKRIVSLSHFLVSSDIQQILSSPITLYGDNQASINIITQNKISSRSRHLDIPVTYSYEQMTKKYFELRHIHSKLNAADASTKALSGPIMARHWNFLRGLRFIPSDSTSHGKYCLSSTTAKMVTEIHKR